MQIDTSGLNKHDAVYHQLTYDILLSPELNFRKADRVVIDTMGVFGNQVEYDLRDETIPLSGTKNIGYKTQLFPEIVGFLRNETNLKWYLDQGMNIWTQNAFDFYRKRLNNTDAHSAWKSLGKDTPEFREALPEFVELVKSGKDSRAGDLGKFYPAQWNAFEGVKKTADGLEVVYVKQIQNLVDTLRDHPSSRYAVVTAWNPYDVKEGNAALAPCHCMFMAYRYTDAEGVERLSIKMFQRSADHHLGVAFNAPQYSAITSTLAELLDIKPGRFIHTFGDLHIYIGKSGSERSNWYKDGKNRLWLQEELQTKHPYEVLDDLLNKLPPEEKGFEGFDHVPFAIKQLGMKSNAEPPKLVVTAKNLKDMEVSDLQVLGYERPPKVEINGTYARMAS